MVWFIVQTNPQCETKAMAEIRRAGFRAYLPKKAREIKHHRTKETILKRSALMPGYIFMRFPDGRPNWYVMRQCQGVKCVLYADGRPYEVAQSVVAAFMRAERAYDYDDDTTRLRKRQGTKLDAKRSRIKKAGRIRVVDGPFASFLGQVDEVTEHGAVTAFLEIMGRAVPFKFENINDIEAVDLADAA